MKCFASVVNMGQTEPPFKHHWIQENDCSSSNIPGTLTARRCIRQHLFLVIASCTLVFSCLGHYHVVKGDLCFPFRRWLHLCYCRKDLYFLLISEECFVMRWQTIHLLSHICVSASSLHTSFTVGHFPAQGSVMPKMSPTSFSFFFKKWKQKSKLIFYCSLSFCV